MEANQHKAQQGHAADRKQHRRLPVGAPVLPSGGVHFRVWATRRQHVEVVLEGGPGYYPAAESVSVALEPEDHGYFSGLVPEADAGMRYRYRLDGGTESYPDVASRFQPDGLHGPSQVIDPGALQWHDQDWRGVPLQGQVLYEMHVGTFTPAGTWEAAIGELPARAELGVTVLELMPSDGLRLDATQNIYDTSADHILAAIARRVRHAAHGRATLLVAENEPQHAKLVRAPERGGYGFDALWNDDFHHSAAVWTARC